MALQEYHKYLDINKGSENARVRFIAFLYLIKHYKDDVTEVSTSFLSSILQAMSC